MGLWDSAGGNGFLSDPERRGGLSASMMGIAQGLLSQRPGESWANALGRGFGQAGALKKQFEQDYRAKQQRGRNEKMRSWAQGRLDEGGLDEKTAILMRLLSTGDQGGMAAGALSAFGQAGAAEMQGSAQNFSAGQAELGRGHDLDMLKQQYQNANAMQRDQIENSLEMQRQDFAGRGQLQTESFAGQGALQNSQWVLRDQFARQQVVNDADRASAVGGINAGYRSKDLEHVADIRSRHRGEDFGYEQQGADAAAARSLDYLGQTTEEDIYKRSQLRPGEREDLSFSIDENMRRDEANARMGMERDAAGSKNAYRSNYFLNLQQQGYNQDNMGQSFENRRIMMRDENKARAESQGRLHEYHLAEQKSANSFDFAMKLPSMQRSQNMRDLLAQRHADPNTSPEERQYIEMLVNMPDAQMTQALIQERGYAANERLAELSRKNRLTDREQLERRQAQTWVDKRQYIEGVKSMQIGQQNEDRYEAMIAELDDKAFYDEMSSRDLLTRMVEGSIRMGQNNGQSRSQSVLTAPPSQ